ncbi:MAG: transglutaminase domain-containing protein [Vicinamibacteria bacterium]
MPETRTVLPSDVDLDESAGDVSVLKRTAAELKRPTVRDTLAAIHQYLGTNLKKVKNPSYGHPSRGRRTSVEMLRTEAWGCSAHAQVACHLARACGVPAILVKSLNLAWVEKENQGDGLGAGHVYVEVLINGNPALWEPEGGYLDEPYDPAATITPNGYHYIYEKGGPDVLVLSHHGPQWEEETQRLFPQPRKA